MRLHTVARACASVPQADTVPSRYVEQLCGMDNVTHTLRYKLINHEEGELPLSAGCSSPSLTRSWCRSDESISSFVHGVPVLVLLGFPAAH